MRHLFFSQLWCTGTSEGGSLKILARALSILLCYSRRASECVCVWARERKRKSRLWSVYFFSFSFTFFLIHLNSINASLLFKARGNYKASHRRFITHSQLFLRENWHARLSSRCLRDIIPRGARPSSSINAFTMLTLPQIRRRAKGGF